MSILAKIVTSVFGTKSDREIKKLRPTLEKINQFYGSLKNKSDDELREKTEKLNDAQSFISDVFCCKNSIPVKAKIFTLTFPFTWFNIAK